MAELIRRMVPPEATVLELGSGTGDVLVSLEPQWGVGLSLAAELTSEAQRKYPHLDFYTLGVDQVVVPQDFRPDYVILNNMLDYVYDVWEVLEQLRFVADERTLLIMTTNNPLWAPLMRLAAFLDSDYRCHFTAEQLRFAQHILDSGSKLERGVLTWCLQNAVPLWQATPDWAIVSYEQLICDPFPVIAHLADKLSLPKPERMRRRLVVPSSSKGKSDPATQVLLGQGMANRSMLVEKWTRRVDATQERRAMEILACFDMDLYRAGDVLPADWMWIKPETATQSLAAS